MNANLPGQPNQPQPREGGLIPSPGRAVEEPGIAHPKAHKRLRLLRLINWQRQVLVFLWVVVFCLCSYVMISRYVATTVIVQGRSMQPTLQDGDYCILNRLAYLYREPKRDEVVVLRDPGHADCAVKRIVGMPCETVLVKDGAVYINGIKRDEAFLSSGTITRCGQQQRMVVVLGPEQYFMLGDNRDHSEDSRTYGPIHRRAIVGLLAH